MRHPDAPAEPLVVDRERRQAANWHIVGS